ncbi:MAG: tetratricopeptide repeat protein [Bacteroidota bacterium]|nr:tetratricopeptide repeat protein [Bacteroidota bacterium]
MKTIRLFVSCFLAVLLFLSNDLPAQKSLVHTDPDKSYKKAIELFEKEKFGAARKEFQDVIDADENPQSLQRIDAEYYQALCAIELFHRDAGFLIDNFILNHPEDPRINQLNFQMGKVQYRKKKYSQTIKFLEKVDKPDLNPEDRTEYYFQLGYSYFRKNKFDKSRLCFFEIKDIDSEFWAASNYFYGHINYSDGDYQTALNSFMRIQEDEMFESVVPYYLTHIYFMQGENEKIKEIAPALLEKSTPKRAPEIARIIGEAYYKTGEYEASIPYLKKYKETGERYEKEDIYQLAYAYYKVGNFDGAIENFEKVARGKSKLSQNAYFHLADCYLKTKDKSKAHKAFNAASNMDYDKDIEEESLLSTAKLSFELSYSPFNQTIKIFNDFLSRFPNSIYSDEVYDYLMKVYMATRNYGEALVSLENIENKTEKIKTAYQRVAFFRATELFSDMNFDKAIQYYDKSLKYASINPSFRAQALYWKAESMYRLKRFGEAVTHYNTFILSPGAISIDEYTIAHYNLAYANFKLDNYSEAVIWFRKYVNKNENASPTVGDSYVRLGDCYFVQRKYAESVKYYDLAISINTSDTDYATFQKAISYGLLHEYGKKNWVLRQMVNNFPKSNYIVDVLFELGKSYVKLDKTEEAVESYNILIDSFPKSSFVPKAYLQLGLIHYNRDNNDAALFAYKQVVDSFPASSQAKNAMLGLRNIYMSAQREDEFFAYAENVDGMAKISVGEKDSLTFLSAERLYMLGDCDKASVHFNKYISNFPEGNYLKQIHYYKADCNLRANNEAAALVSFEYLANLPRNEYTEDALSQSARMYFEKGQSEKALKNYEKLEAVAEKSKNMLESRIGQMRCNYKLKKIDASIESANKVVISDKIQARVMDEAHFVLAKSFLSKEDKVSAINEFKYISENTNTKQGAEAKYRVAEILFDQEKFDEAEKEIMEYNKMNTPHQFWLAKSIILLSDVYVVKDDDFQARHTLESVIQYYDIPNDGIVQTAREKLNEILEREEAETLFNEMQDLELDFNENQKGEYDELFESEEKTQDSTKTEVE